MTSSWLTRASAKVSIFFFLFVNVHPSLTGCGMPGHAVQWGEVSRKKEKKSTTGSHATPESPRDSAGGRNRGEFRGGRGARGGRGGRGSGRRDASSRGQTRTGPREVNGRHAPAAGTVDVPAFETAEQTADSTWANGASTSNDTAKQAATTSAAWASEAQVEGWGAKADESPAVDTWANGTDHTPATWGSTEEVKVPVKSAPAPTAQPTKTPATSKMSWAQIARYVS